MLEQDVSKRTIAYSLTSATAVAFLVVVVLLNNNLSLSRLHKDEPQPVVTKAQIDYFNGISLQAHAAFVYDINSHRILFEKNSSLALPLASLTKAMTAIVAADETLSNPDKEITIGSEALNEEGDSGLKEGERWKLSDLLSFTLVVSSNDGARSIANIFSGVNTETRGDAPANFITKMNQKAVDLNLPTMHFTNPTGLDAVDGSEIGGYGSARDVAKLFEYAVRFHPGIFDATRYPERNFTSDTLLHDAVNTNIITNKIPNIVAGKTGYTDQAGGNLAVVFDRGLNEPVVMVVIGSTYDGRFSDMLLLASSTVQTYNEN